jgi:DNA-binding response OmpR family regulator
LSVKTTKKVLIVDDEPDILLMLRVDLEAEGYETTLAADGETALRRISEERPDLVLLDVMMPVVDGWGVLQRMSTGGHHAPVVMVSAKASDQDAVRALELGATEYVVKPFDPTLLLSTVADVLSSSPTDLDANRRRRLHELTGN